MRYLDLRKKKVNMDFILKFIESQLMKLYLVETLQWCSPKTICNILPLYHRIQFLELEKETIQILN